MFKDDGLLLTETVSQAHPLQGESTTLYQDCTDFKSQVGASHRPTLKQLLLSIHCQVFPFNLQSVFLRAFFYFLSVSKKDRNRTVQLIHDAELREAGM